SKIDTEIATSKESEAFWKQQQTTCMQEIALSKIYLKPTEVGNEETSDQHNITTDDFAEVVMQYLNLRLTNRNKFNTNSNSYKISCSLLNMQVDYYLKKTAKEHDVLQIRQIQKELLLILSDHEQKYKTSDVTKIKESVSAYQGCRN